MGWSLGKLQRAAANLNIRSPPDPEKTTGRMFVIVQKHSVKPRVSESYCKEGDTRAYALVASSAASLSVLTDARAQTSPRHTFTRTRPG